MLRFLKIRDFALIHSLEIDFGPGINLLTGETGSGKSIVVDAVGLLVGRRSSPEMVRSGCQMAVVEGSFTYDPAGPIPRLLADSGIEAEEDSLLVRREITSGGRSRVFVDDSLVTLSLMKSIGDSLADIHSQQDLPSLLELSAHLEWLDRFGKNMDLAAPVRESYRKLVEINRQLDSMRMDEQERLRRVDVLQFQINEIRGAKLQPQEKDELENEKNLLANREKIFALSSEAYGLLYEHESSILGQARRLERILQELNSVDLTWSAHRDALAESIYKLMDLAYAMRDYTMRIDFSPERLNQVEQRLSDLAGLAGKYGNSIAVIIGYADKYDKELELLRARADTSKQLAHQFDSESKNYLACAGILSDKRRRDATRLEREVRKEFEALAMEKMELGVQFHPRAAGEHSGRIPGYYGPGGVDRVEFMIAPNEGEDMKSLAKIASGGELSRVMLAIKSLCGGGEGGKTLVFDEVDVGIGGRVAEAVGRRLRAIAETNQVLCVTHLPQIAAFAEHHFNVSKELVGSRTETTVALLRDTDRIEELARMLGGEIITEITRRHAREMLRHSSSTAGAVKKGKPEDE